GPNRRHHPRHLIHPRRRDTSSSPPSPSVTTHYTAAGSAVPTVIVVLVPFPLIPLVPVVPVVPVLFVVVPAVPFLLLLRRGPLLLVTGIVLRVIAGHGPQPRRRGSGDHGSDHREPTERTSTHTLGHVSDRKSEVAPSHSSRDVRFPPVASPAAVARSQYDRIDGEDERGAVACHRTLLPSRPLQGRPLPR